MTIGENIGRLLKERKLSQVDLARYVGVTTITVCRWIPKDNKKTKQCTPNFPTIVRIASFFHVLPSDIDESLIEKDLVELDLSIYSTEELFDELKRRWSRNDC